MCLCASGPCRSRADRSERGCRFPLSSRMVCRKPLYFLRQFVVSHPCLRLCDDLSGPVVPIGEVVMALAIHVLICMQNTVEGAVVLARVHVLDHPAHGVLELRHG